MSSTVEYTASQMILAGAFAFVVLSVLAGSFGSWIWCISLWTSKRSSGFWRRQPNEVTVGLFDLFLLVACLFIFQLMILAVVKVSDGSLPATKEVAAVADTAEANDTSEGEVSKKEKPASATSLTLGCLGLLFATVMSATVTCVRLNIPAWKIGFRLDQFWKDVGIGVLTFVMAAPVVLTLSQIVTVTTKVKYEHPVIDAMRENFSLFPALIVSAAIVAPLWEEFVFRGLLIQWFDTMRVSRWNIVRILLGRNPIESSSIADDRDAIPMIQPSESGNPYSPGLLIETAPSSSFEVPAARAEIAEERAPWWPAIFSGVLFGLAHFEYGVSWVPLMVFGIALGRVYQMRRSVIPCIVAHALFNSLSMFALATNLLVNKSV